MKIMFRKRCHCHLTVLFCCCSELSEENMRKSLSLVGQEQDGTLLFHWTDFSPGQEIILVSYIGAYNPHKQAVKTLFTHEDKVDIINATVNKEHSFLGFTTHELAEVTGAQGRATTTDLYKAYIAEIQPQNRVFYLNLERQNMIKLQFLYGNYRPHQTARESHLLVLLHRESIGLYHLPVARAGNDAVIMSGEPKKDEILQQKRRGGFAWYQFDAAQQRLYVIYHQRKVSTPRDVTSGYDVSVQSGYDATGRTTADHHQARLAVYQFCQQAARMAQLMMDIPLNIPVPYVKTNYVSKYLYLGPYHAIPDASLNMEVLTNQAGAICLCFQNIFPSKSKRLSDSDTATMHYSVYVIHKEKMLNVQCPSLPARVVTEGRLSFAWLDGYLLVYLRGFFIHLLNVGVDYDLSLHIMYKDAEECSSVPAPLINFCGDKHLHSQSGVSLFDVSTSQVVRLEVDTSRLLHLFTDCTYLPTRAAVLHYAAVQTRDLALVRQIIEYLSLEPCGFDLVKLFQEYLTGSMFALLPKSIDRSFVRYLPYTSVFSSVSKGQVYCDKMERICTLSCTSIDHIKFEESVFHSEESFWQHFIKNIEDRQWAINCRFDLNSVRHKMDLTPEAPTPPKQADEPQESQSFFQRITSFVTSSSQNEIKKAENATVSAQTILGRPTSRTDAILGRPPAFITRDENLFSKTRYSSKTVALLSEHLLSFLSDMSRTKIRKVAEECVRCQTHACRLLCHLVWSVLGDQQYEDKLLTDPASEEEQNLFLMYQRVLMAADRLSFPLPNGFNEFFARLGYRCQEPIEFRQYLDRGVYRISVDSVNGFIGELDDSEINVQLKWGLIHTLSREGVLLCLRHWSHPSAQQYIVHEHVDQVFKATSSEKFDSSFKKDKNKAGRPKSQEKLVVDTAVDQAAFPPLQAFLKYMEARGASSNEDGLHLDTDLLRSASMSRYSEQ